MIISLLKEIFLEKLEFASRFTSSRLSSSTSLQGVLISGEKNKLVFYSTNLNFYYKTELKIENDKDFSIVVEPKKIIEFLSLLDPGKIEIEIKDKEIIISQGKNKGDFSLFSKTDFPLPPIVNDEKNKINSDFFTKNIPLLAFSASSDETRPVLTGINFVGIDDNVSMVSTDGFRLSILTIKKNIPLRSMIIPTSFLLDISRLITSQKEVEFSYLVNERMLVFFIDNHIIYSRLIDGDFPPYERVIPVDKKTTIIVDREEMQKKVKLASVFARDFSNIVVIKTNQKELEITPKTSDGRLNVVYLDAEIKGEEQKIAFNYKFLLDFLNNIKSDKIIIELLRSDSPVVFKSEKQPDFLHIIMPVRISE